MAQLSDPVFISKLRAGFDYFDKDKNGTVDKNEIGSLLKWIDMETPQSQIDSTVRNF